MLVPSLAILIRASVSGTRFTHTTTFTPSPRPYEKCGCADCRPNRSLLEDHRVQRENAVRVHRRLDADGGVHDTEALRLRLGHRCGFGLDLLAAQSPVLGVGLHRLRGLFFLAAAAGDEKRQEEQRRPAEPPPDRTSRSTLTSGQGS